MIRVLVEDYDTVHPYVVYYYAWLIRETPDAWYVWHLWRHPLGEWIQKNSIDQQVKK